MDGWLRREGLRKQGRDEDEERERERE